jgi:ribosomal protein L11 methyltransferase
LNWLELLVSADLAAVEALSALFYQHGEGGVAVDQPFYTDPEGERYGIDVLRPAKVSTYIPDTADGAQRLKRIEEGLWHLSAFNLAPIGELQVRRVAEDDWANAWKDHYQPLRIGRILIKPSWRDVDPDPDAVVVEIDPGMAFGTGVHQTTRMCLAAVSRLVQPGWTILDQGTGSGILAVAAAKLGADLVMARDIAEVAVEATEENARRNGVLDQLRVDRISPSAAPLDQVVLSPDQPLADMIVANIVANVLIHLSSAFVAASKPGALLIASGIIRDRADEVEGVLSQAGYSIEERIGEDEWVTLVARLATTPSPASS